MHSSEERVLIRYFNSMCLVYHTPAILWSLTTWNKNELVLYFNGKNPSTKFQLRNDGNVQYNEHEWIPQNCTKQNMMILSSMFGGTCTSRALWK